MAEKLMPLLIKNLSLFKDHCWSLLIKRAIRLLASLSGSGWCKYSAYFIYVKFLFQ